MVELRNWAAALGLTIAAAASCQIISGGDDFGFGGQGPATSAGGVGGAGGGLECTKDNQCEGTDEICRPRRCVDGACIHELAELDTPCDYDNGRFCDGDGACVDCNDASQCLTTEDCSTGKCVPKTCNNGIPDGDETGRDCGGSCEPCGSNLGCLEATDCASGFCDMAAGGSGGAAGGGAGGGPASGTCAPCGSTSDCSGLSDTYCLNGTCLRRKEKGESCGANNECLSGYCPADDGVCCNVECAEKCRACLGTKTGQENGVCYNVPNNTDPDSDCLLNCTANGACQGL